MTGDSHPTEQGAGKPLEAPQSREAPLVGTERRPGGEFGPQAATDGFDGPEIHHWDAAKTAEVARILAEHPPRAQWTTSNVAQPPTAKDWCLDNVPLTVALGYPVRCPHCPQTASPVPPTHWTKHLQRHHPEAPMPEPTPAACTPACSEQHTYVPPCELASAPASADLREVAAEACCVCAGSPVVYRNYRDQPFCAHCANCDCGENPCVRTGVNDPDVSRNARHREQIAEAIHATSVCEVGQPTHCGGGCADAADAVLRVPAIAEALGPSSQAHAEPPVHIGGRANAEDCPACRVDPPPYPWICPGEPQPPANDQQEQQ